MKSFVVAVMLLAFVMGLGYANFGRLSKECKADPWERLNKSEASQKKCQAVNWEETNV